MKRKHNYIQIKQPKDRTIVLFPIIDQNDETFEHFTLNFHLLNIVRAIVLQDANQINAAYNTISSQPIEIVSTVIKAIQNLRHFHPTLINSQNLNKSEE